MSNERFLPAFLQQLEERGEVAPHHWDHKKNRELDPHQVDAMSAITDSVRQSVEKLDVAHISIQQSGGSGKTTLITNLAGAALDVRALQANGEGKVLLEMGVKPSERKEEITKTFGQWVGILRQWNSEHANQMPSGRSEEKEEKMLGQWLQNIRQKLRDDAEFAKGEGKVLLEMGVKPAEKKEGIRKTFEQWVGILHQWNSDHANQMPSRSSKNEGEKRLAEWLGVMRLQLRDDAEFAKGEGKVLLEMGVKPAKKIT